MMDLFDALEASPIKAKTFRKNINVTIAAEDVLDDSETQAIGEDDEDSIDFFGKDDLNTEETNISYTESENTSHISATAPPPPIANLLGFSSLLNKVKRRLNGESEESEAETQVIDTQVGNSLQTQGIYTEETQKIQNEETQKIETDDLETQVIETDTLETQRIEHDTLETQRVKTPANISSQISSHYIYTQKEKSTQAISSLVEGQLIETQKITTHSGDEGTQIINTAVTLKSTTIDPILEESEESEDDEEIDVAKRTKNNLFMYESDSEAEVEKDLSKPEPTQEELDQLEKTQKEQRVKKIEELAQKKKIERLLKEQDLKNKDSKDLNNTPKEEQEYEEEVSHPVEQDVAIDIEAVTVKKFDSNSLLKAFGMVQKQVSLTQSQIVRDTQQTQDIELSSDNDDEQVPMDTDLGVKSKPNIHKIPDSLQSKLKEKLKESDSDIVILEDSESDEDDGLFLHSKSTVLDIKAKFSKKIADKQKCKKTNPALMSKRQLFDQLMNANKKQIQEEKLSQPELNKEPDALKQETLDVQDLLQRHIERNNRLREAEEAAEKKKKALDDSEDEDYDGEVPESDVPESDVPESEDELEVERIDIVSKSKKSRRNIIEDDEDNDNEDDEAGDNSDAKPEIPLSQINDNGINLGDFGGNLTQSFDSLGGKVQGLKNISLTQVFEKGSQAPLINKSSAPQFDLFANLKQKANKVIGEVSFTENGTFDNSFNLSFELPNDNKIVEQDDDEIEASAVDATQRDPSTQDIEATNTDLVQDDDEEEVNHKFKPKRLTKRRAYESDNESEEEETQEQLQERIKQVELLKKARREQERKLKQQKREMKAKGLDKMMEAEAEESEDEWHGIGGADGERSDEENSADEEMLDDYTKIKYKKEEILEKIRNESNAEDRSMLERLLKDLESGKLGKRGKDSDFDFDLDIDDGEDEVMRSYRIYNQMKRREQLEQDEALRKLAKDKKSKAFFDTITEEVKGSKSDIFAAVEDSQSESESESENNPFEIKKKDFKDPSTITKKKKVTVAFVQKTLSFISNPDENDESSFNRRYSIGDDDNFSDDLHTLKQNSIVKIASKTPERRNKSAIDLTKENDLSPSNLFKRPSIISRSSFQLLEKENSNQVTVSTTTKTTSSSKASIMSFGKRSIDLKKSTIREQRVLKVRKIAAKFGSQNNRLKKLNSNDGFD